MICLKGIHKSYGSNEALKGITFSIERGEVLGLLGHNGAGKTTTLKLLATILEPNQGEIEILEPEATDMRDPIDFKARLGFLPDEPFQFPYLSGREMLFFIGALYQIDRETMVPRIQALLERFDLAAGADQLIHTYSRGMKRKVSVIGSLMHDPLLWLLDEPTESLDPVTIRVLKDTIREFRQKNRAVVLSTHHLSLAEELCDRLVILHQGAMIFEGTLSALRRAAGSEFSTLEDIYVRACQ